MTRRSPPPDRDIFPAAGRRVPWFDLEVDDQEPHEAALQRLWSRGRDRYPSLELPLEAFARCLRARGVALTAGWERLNADDLYLACACAQQVGDAIETFRREHGPAIEGFVSTVEHRPEAAKEIAEAILGEVLVGHPPAPPKLVGYSGRGPLRGWLRMIAVRRSHDEVRDRGRHRAVEERLFSEAIDASDDPDLVLLKRRYRADFLAAFRDAFDGLAAPAKALLRLHYGETLGLTAIAALKGWSRQGAGERIAEAREALMTRARELLQARLQLQESELGGLLRVLRNQLDQSLSAMFDERKPPGKP
jgi:RNA polymerase sigma-70 factor, ECF subfamily